MGGVYHIISTTHCGSVWEDIFFIISFMATINSNKNHV